MTKEYEYVEEQYLQPAARERNATPGESLPDNKSLKHF